MNLRNPLRHGPLAAMIAAALVLAGAPALAQTSLRLSLDWRLEGPSAIFLVPQDRGYFRQEGLDVDIIRMSCAVSVRALVAKSIDFEVAPESKPRCPRLRRGFASKS